MIVATFVTLMAGLAVFCAGYIVGRFIGKQEAQTEDRE